MNLLSEKEIKQKLDAIKGWKYEGNRLGKEFVFKDFRNALQFVNDVGEEAEKIDHHPEIFLHSWNKVKITVSTHSAGGVTENDFTLAKKIEELNI